MGEKAPNDATINTIRLKIKPYDLIYLPKTKDGKPACYVFRKPVELGELVNAPQWLIERGYSLVEFKRVYTENDAAIVVKEIIHILKT